MFIIVLLISVGTVWDFSSLLFAICDKAAQSSSKQSQEEKSFRIKLSNRLEIRKSAGNFANMTNTNAARMANINNAACCLPEQGNLSAFISRTTFYLNFFSYIQNLQNKIFLPVFINIACRQIVWRGKPRSVATTMTKITSADATFFQTLKMEFTHSRLI